MRMLKPALLIANNIIRTNPGAVTGTILFLAAFSVFAGNAVFKQANAHVSPLWVSSEANSIQGKPGKELSGLGDVVGSVKPTPMLLQNSRIIASVPVPQINPAKGQPVSSQSSLVREIQTLLSEVGIYKGRNDGIFGDETRLAIREFQNRSGIIPDGMASFGLLASIKSAIAVSNTSQGRNPVRAVTQPQPQVSPTNAITPDMIARIQTALRDMYGEDRMVVDGIFGQQTRNVLKKFQQRFNIGVTGELDRATMNKLQEAGIIRAG